MAYEFLKKLFGESKEGEQPKAMTYQELEAALDAAKDVQVVNLKGGGYVAKEKLDAKITELDGVKTQLAAANEQIQSFKGKATDIEAANQKVAEWENKYNTDTAALQEKLTQQARSHAEDMFMAGYKFTSKAAKRGVLDDFRAQNFTLDDEGVFRGGKEYMDSLMQNEEYKGAFVTEDADAGNAGGNGAGQGQAGAAGAGQQGQNFPRFAQGAQGAQPPQNNDNPFNFNFTRLRQPPANK